MNSPNGNLPEAPKDLRRICPFLGLIDDPETSLAYPAEMNYCHCALPPGVPRFDYQSERCLSASFAACSVYIARDKGPLPPEIRLYPGGKRIQIQTTWLLRVMGAILLAALIFFIGWFGVAGLSRSFSENNLAKTRTGLPVLPTTGPFAPAATRTLPHFPSPTLQPSPTETPTPTPPVLIYTSNPLPPQTSCGRPSSWVAYTVQPTDTLYRLSLAFGVTVGQLQSANCMGNSTILHVGRTLYVPPWAMNPILPTLEPTWPLLTEIPTETPVGNPTETPVPTSTEIPTEVPTEVPTETPTP